VIRFSSPKVSREKARETFGEARETFGDANHIVESFLDSSIPDRFLFSASPLKTHTLIPNNPYLVCAVVWL
jgi:hypothetical protein